jgi:murein DD-endopeptidase MepM/ murein hydrolase activator NlpD
MAYQLSDIYIGSFARTQSFGDRRDFYNARFGLQGHNGTDWSCPSMTPILSAADGWVSEKGFDVAGYGNYIKVVHDGYLTLYGHLNDIAVGDKERVVAGQLLGHSDNTGLSDGPHLHFGVAPCDANGIKSETGNGFSGYIDPLGARCEWKITNPTSPVNKSANDEPPIGVPSAKFKELVAKSTNLDIVSSKAVSSGLNEYLQSENVSIVDLQNNPTDPDAGNKIASFIGRLVQENHDLEYRISQIGGAVPVEQPLSAVQSQSLIDKVTQAIRDFVFVQQ